MTLLPSNWMVPSMFDLMVPSTYRSVMGDDGVEDEAVDDEEDEPSQPDVQEGILTFKLQVVGRQ